MRVKGILNRIVVRPDPSEEVSKGGIVIPDKAKDKPRSGTIVFIGLGKVDNNGRRIPMDVNLGDTVFYAPSFAIPLKLDNEEFVVLRDEDILLAVEE